jgi:hypothetical protein
VELYKHLLDQIKNNCEKSNYRSLAGIEPKASSCITVNVYKFPLDNLHVQDPSTIIMSEMPTESLRIIYSVLNN